MGDYRLKETLPPLYQITALTNAIAITVTTIYPQYSIAREIAKDKANVKMLLKPGQEMHSYEPSPKDIKEIQDADIFIYNGGHSDAWVDEMLKSLDTEKTKIVKLMEFSEKL